MEVLQTSALPLGYGAIAGRSLFTALYYVCLEAISKIPLVVSVIKHRTVFETVSSQKLSVRNSSVGQRVLSIRTGVTLV
jgi:hypothetical protein